MRTPSKRGQINRRQEKEGKQQVRMCEKNGVNTEASVCPSAPLVGGDDCYSRVPIEVSNQWAVTT